MTPTLQQGIECPLSRRERARARAFAPDMTYPHPLPLSRKERVAICNLQFVIHNLQSTKKRAFSILEVILALAILTGAMAVLGELGRLGFRNARAAQDLTKAQMLCESKMAEYTSGITLPQAVSGTAFDTIDQDPNSSASWVYSVTCSKSIRTA